MSRDGAASAVDRCIRETGSTGGFLEGLESAGQDRPLSLAKGLAVAFHDSEAGLLSASPPGFSGRNPASLPGADPNRR